VTAKSPTLGLLVALASVAPLAPLTGACSKKPDAGSEPPSTTSMVASATGDARIVADEHGYTPSSITVPRGPAGSKVTLTFVRTSDKTCATEVVFPALDLEKPLPLGQPVPVQLPADTPRTLSFQCAMGMFKGALVVK
jgi:plastocyanin domain-containing protein